MGIFDNDGFNPNWVDPSIVLPPIFTPTNLTKPIPTSQEIKPYSLSKRVQVQGSTYPNASRGVVKITDNVLLPTGSYILGVTTNTGVIRCYATNVDTGVVTYLFNKNELLTALGFFTDFNFNIVNNILYIVTRTIISENISSANVYTFKTLNLSSINTTYNVKDKAVSLGLATSLQNTSVVNGATDLDLGFLTSQYGLIGVCYVNNSDTTNSSIFVISLEENSIRKISDNITAYHFVKLYQYVFGSNKFYMHDDYYSDSGTYYIININDVSYSTHLLSNTSTIGVIRNIVDENTMYTYWGGQVHLVTIDNSYNCTKQLIDFQGFDPDFIVKTSTGVLASYFYISAIPEIYGGTHLQAIEYIAPYYTPTYSLVPEDIGLDKNVPPTAYQSGKNMVHDAEGRAVFVYAVYPAPYTFPQQYIARL